MGEDHEQGAHVRSPEPVQRRVRELERQPRGALSMVRDAQQARCDAAEGHDGAAEALAARVHRSRLGYGFRLHLQRFARGQDFPADFGGIDHVLSGILDAAGGIGTDVHLPRVGNEAHWECSVIDPILHPLEDDYGQARRTQQQRSWFRRKVQTIIETKERKGKESTQHSRRRSHSQQRSSSSNTKIETDSKSKVAACEITEARTPQTVVVKEHDAVTAQSEVVIVGKL
mmetsp:Transcript_6755/g.18354  ORF Transcript_6755/g.18354 Transcript_6755/m.18354 type:complete len:229 (-) Transcript_6755:813-1499(-)